MASSHLTSKQLGFSLQELQHQCNATFPGDSDIDGDGMLISSITFALITSIIALLNAWAERDIGPSFKSWIDAEQQKCRSQGSTSMATHWSRRWLYDFSNKMLSSMCDLQLITGLGIMTAAFFGLESFSLFHLNMINSYYWLSLTGLWVVGSLSSYDGSRVFTDGPSTHRGSGTFERLSAWLSRRDVLQKLLIVPSIVLGIIMQIVLFRKATKEWDNQTSGRCFRDDDRSSWQSTWVWVVGLCLYDVGVLLSFHSTTASIRTYVECKLSTVERRCMQTARGLFPGKISPASKQPLPQTSTTPSSPPAVSSSRSPTSLKTFVHQCVSTILCGLVALILLVFTWCLRQTLALCALADGTPLLVAIYCLSFFSWSAYDIIGNKILNQALIVDNTTWGFGQILPLVLMLAVVFNAIDAVKFANDKQAENKLLPEIQQWPSSSVASSCGKNGVSHFSVDEEKQSLLPTSSGVALQHLKRPLFRCDDEQLRR